MRKLNNVVRLPIPGQDDGSWGSILNDFLSVELSSDGTLKKINLITGAEQSSNKNQPNGYAGLDGSGLVPVPHLAAGTPSSSNFLRGDGTWAVPAGGGSSNLASDTDVAIVSPTNNQVLTYNTGTSKWINQAPLVTSVAGKSGVVTLVEGDIASLTNDLNAKLTAASNLSDLTNAATARSSLGLGTAATDDVDTTASDIQPLGVRAAGSVGKIADAGHVHAMPRLDQVSGPTASVSLNSQKITNLANGSASSDAAAFGQIPANLPPNGTAGGDLGGTYPNPTVVATHLSAALPVLQGGTGQTTTSAAFNALSPNTTLGDVTYANGANSNTRLAGNTTSTKQFLTQTGTGTISAAPVWSAIQAADVPTLNQSTSGNAATVTTNANLTGDVTSVGNAATLVSTANVKTVIETVRLDQMAAPTASVSLNSQKITSLANGSAATDAAAFGQVPVASATIPVVNSTTAPSAGSSTAFSRGDHSHPRYDWTPADYGMATWSFDQALGGTASTPLATAGTMYVIRLHLPIATSITNMLTYVITGGGTLTSSQCFGALYQGGSGGSLVGVTGDQSGTWNSAGTKTMALAGGPFAVAAGDVYAAFWFNGTTGPAFLRGFSNGTSPLNLGLAATASRFGTANTSITTSGTAPPTLGTISALNTAYWVALS